MRARRETRVGPQPCAGSLHLVMARQRTWLTGAPLKGMFRGTTRSEGIDDGGMLVVLLWRRLGALWLRRRRRMRQLQVSQSALRVAQHLRRVLRHHQAGHLW